MYVAAILLTIFFGLPLIGLLLGYRPWETTRPSNASSETQDQGSSTDDFVRALSIGLSKHISVDGWGSSEAPESEPEPTPRPLSPWLDESR